MIEKIIAKECTQQVIHGPCCEFDMGRQPRIDGMCNLVDVVSDAPQLGEQRRIDPVEGRGCDLHLPLEDKPLAVGSDLQTRAHRFDLKACVRFIRHADVDLAVTSLRR